MPLHRPLLRLTRLLLPLAMLATGCCSSSLNDAADRNLDSPEHVADIVSLDVSGTRGAYEFSVGVASPDEGCHQYADWWEVVGEDGRLLYRRILTHSHIHEQPFVRSGNPVPIEPNQSVWVRAHMHPDGYGGAAFYGSVERGFRETSLDPTFAAGLARRQPLPDGCAG